MLGVPTRSLLLAASFALTPVALATDLIEVVNPGEIQVNGTAGNDLLMLDTMCDGSVLVIRQSFLCLAVGVIPAEDVAINLIVVVAGAGDDYIDTTSVSAAASLDVLGGAGSDVIDDGPGNSVLIGDDTVPGPGDGNDYIYGGQGSDLIIGGGGFRDVLHGQGGDDAISDHDGVAQASGGHGNDSIGVIFDAAWDNNSNPFDTRRINQNVMAGGGDDFVNLILLGTAVRVNLDGDNGSGSGGVEGTADELFIQSEVPLAPNSSFQNFEVVTIEPLP